MRLVQLEVPDLMDVPESLIRLGQQMKTGESASSTRAILVSVRPDGVIDIYGFGEIQNRIGEVGLLQMAAMKMALD
jgi:hypothetical protein